MLTIYGVHRSRASRNIWLCLEAGIPFKQVPVIQANRVKDPNAADAPLHTRSAEFLKINPNGHVPSIDDDGLVLHESLAINLYLARKAGGVFGPKDLSEEGQMAMWSLWIATELEPHAILILYHRIMWPQERRDAAVAAAAEKALSGPVKILNDALAATGYLVGGRFTAVDIGMAEVVKYLMGAPDLLAANPNVKAWLTACQSRDAFKKMIALRDAAEPA